jgi:hypothetical protein
MQAVLDILGAFFWCADIRGVLRHGPGYWTRTRRIERWRYMKETAR